MPNFTNYLYRHWCTTCNEWMLFTEKGKFGEGKMHCTECDTEHQRVLLSNIPEEKIQEQRKRYSEQQRQNICDVYSEFLGGRSNPLFDLFAPVENKTRIVEGDAGQKFVDDERKQKESEENETL